MRARALVFAVGFVAAGLGACAYANGYDPSRYPSAAPVSSVDPEIEPLPPSPKRRMRDPRGAPAFDAGVSGGALAVGPALTDASVATEDAGANVVVECGTSGNRCPMQRFMHEVMETAHTPDTLTSAFTRVAGISPDPQWAWTAIATRGADLANAGEVARAKAQCVACHDAYREPYKSRHRARAL